MQFLKFDRQTQGLGPVEPFWTVDWDERPDGDPWHAERVGDDDTVHGLAHDQAALADRGDDRQRIVTRIDQVSGERRHLVPGAALRAFEMRHEADPPAFAARHEARERNQRGRVANAKMERQAQMPRRARAADPMHDPGLVQRNGRFVPT